VKDLKLELLRRNIDLQAEIQFAFASAIVASLLIYLNPATMQITKAVARLIPLQLLWPTWPLSVGSFSPSPPLFGRS